MLDLFTDALNSPPGQLAEVLINKLGSESVGELSPISALGSIG